MVRKLAGGCLLFCLRHRGMDEEHSCSKSPKRKEIFLNNCLKKQQKSQKIKIAQKRVDESQDFVII